MAKRKAAVFTIAQDEKVFLPLWWRHYMVHFDSGDVYVLDHGGTQAPLMGLFNRIPVHNDHSFDHEWLRGTVMAFQRFLLHSYEAVLFAEADEMVFADPALYPGGLRQFIRQHAHRPVLRCSGYDLVHDPDHEPPIDLGYSKKLLAQRGRMRPSEIYSKSLIARVPCEWSCGFHNLLAPAEGPPTPGLYLMHLRRMDYDIAWERSRQAGNRRWCPDDLAMGRGYQNRIQDEDVFRQWFFADFHDGRYRNYEAVPAAWKEAF